MKTFMMTALAAAMASSVAVAEVSVPNTFTQGENAVAAEVNANFGALVTAIEESNSRIAALEEKLEEAVSVDVKGSSYLVQSSSVSLTRFEGDPDGVVDHMGSGLELVVEKFTLTFNEDQTVELALDFEYKAERNDQENLKIEETTEEEGEQLFWSQEGNSIQLSDSLGGEPVVEFVVAEGANIIYSADVEVVRNEFRSASGCGVDFLFACYEDYFDSGTLMGVRQSSAQ
jgi:hypothetical protein